MAPAHKKAAHRKVATVKHITHAKRVGSRKPHHANNGTTHHTRRHK